MALTDDQRHLLIGGGIGALALVVGLTIFGDRPAAAAPITDVQPPPPPPPQPRISVRDQDQPKRRKRRDDERDERDEQDRGEYGKKRKKHRRHAVVDVSVGQRPQQLLYPTPRRDEGPGAAIWQLNDRARRFAHELGNTMSKSEQRWAAMHPVWERDVLPFLTEWEPFWRDSSKWSWSEFDRWATRWNAIVTRMTALIPKERGRGW